MVASETIKIMGRSSSTREPQIIESVHDINDSDDSEIDEDEAFNSEDELMYGNFFSSSKKEKKSSSSSSGSKKSAKGDSDDDSGSDAGSDSDDDDDASKDGSGGSSDEHDWAGTEGSDEDEEDDGGAYMLDLLNNLDKQVPTGKDDKSSSKKGKGEGGKIALANNIAAEAAVHLKEGEFQSGALAAMDNTSGGDGKLTLDSLMGGIADTAGFTSVQKSMRALSSGTQLGGGGGDDGKGGEKKKLETTSAPVSRVLSERASRKVHYEATTEDVTRWKDAIYEQRDAETLDFRTNAGGARTNRVTRDTLVDKFEAKTDFEKELQDALEKAGMEDEKVMKKREKKRLTGEDGVDGEDVHAHDGGTGFSSDEDENENEAAGDDLGSNRITLAEYKKRHGELAKLRALMFYEEQKRHRINKIKSKKYRKIRKRQSERLKDAEEEAARADGSTAAVDALDRERIEREEMDRMKERMTLAHKNTSKWAKRVLRRGAKMDVEERRAISLQIAKGEELRRKVLGVDGDGNDSGSEDESEENLLKKARDILMENDNDDDDEEGGKGKKKGLFQLEFMKRGMEAQRVRAKEEARKLLEELEANEAACRVSSDEDDSSDSEVEEKAREEKPKKRKTLTEAETNRVLPEGKLVASSLKFGKADGFAVKVDGNIELDGSTNAAAEMKATEIVKNDDAEEEDEEEVAQVSTGKKKRNRKKNKIKNQSASTDDAVAATPTEAAGADEEEENPWITSTSTSTKKKSAKPLSRTVNINEAASMLVDAPQDSSGKRKRGEDDSKIEATDDTKKKDEEVGVAELSQAELVRRAFAAPADLEAEEEFEKEKVRLYWHYLLSLSMDHMLSLSMNIQFSQHLLDLYSIGANERTR